MNRAKSSFLIILAMAVLTAGAFGLGVLVGPQVESPASALPPRVDTVPEDQVLTAGTFRRIATRTQPAVVSITAQQKARRAPHPLPDENEGDFFEWFFGPRNRLPVPEQRRENLGSGVIINARGEIITNNHVVENAEEITVALQDGRTMEAEVIGTDPSTDVALIHVTGNDLPYVDLGDSDQLQVGDWVVAIGNPFQYRYSVTVGVVSAKERSLNMGPYDDFIQTDAAINPGNSGGPLLDLGGRVVGINTAISFSGFRQSAGIGFAIPVNLIREILPQLRDKGRVDRGYLGVVPQDLTPEIARSLRIPVQEGALVVQVDEGTPAEKAGLEVYDMIVAWDGHPVGDSKDLRRLVAATAPGDRAEVTILRKGDRKTLKVRVAERPDTTAAVPGARPGSTMELGMEVQTVTPELARRLDLPATSGVLITSVELGSPSQKAGLRQGDVILDVDTRAVDDDQEFLKAVREKAGETAILRIRRGNASLIVPIQVPE